MHISIIGAGISGLMSALELVEQGCQVDLYDGQDQGQASWAGGGILSPMYPWRYPHAVNVLAQPAEAMYQKWNEHLKAYTGIDVEIHQTGMLIFDESDQAIGVRYADLTQNAYQHASMLQANELAAQFPLLHPNLKQAVHFSKLSNIRNPRLMNALKSYLSQHQHVRYLQQKVMGIEQQHGRISHLKLIDGTRQAVDQVLFTAGAWSGQWLEALGIHFEVQPIHGQMMVFKAPANWLNTMCMNRIMYLIPRRDGHIVCGSSMRMQDFNLGLNPETSADIYAASLAIVPELSRWPVIKEWAGFRPGSQTGIPVIGQSPRFNNAWVNTGHFRNGLCMAPASAQLIRQLILAQDTSTDATAYRPIAIEC